MNAGPAKSEKYFGFPQEIVFAQLKNYTIRLLDNKNLSLVENPGGTGSCFVKLYLFEREICRPLEKQLSLSGMTLRPISTKCSGLKVLAPVPIHKPNQAIVYLDDEVMNQIYVLYKEYISNFKPTLNSSSVLLYIYKQMFNIKNQNFTQAYSQEITKRLASDVVLRFI